MSTDGDVCRHLRIRRSAVRASLGASGDPSTFWMLALRRCCLIPILGHSSDRQDHAPRTHVSMGPVSATNRRDSVVPFARSVSCFRRPSAGPSHCRRSSGGCSPRGCRRCRDGSVPPKVRGSAGECRVSSRGLLEVSSLLRPRPMRWCTRGRWIRSAARRFTRRLTSDACWSRLSGGREEQDPQREGKGRRRCGEVSAGTRLGSDCSLAGRSGVWWKIRELATSARRLKTLRWVSRSQPIR